MSLSYHVAGPRSCITSDMGWTTSRAGAFQLTVQLVSMAQNLSSHWSIAWKLWAEVSTKRPGFCTASPTQLGCFGGWTALRAATVALLSGAMVVQFCKANVEEIPQNDQSLKAFWHPLRVCCARLARTTTRPGDGQNPFQVQV